jgi:hypothetical protein
MEIILVGDHVEVRRYLPGRIFCASTDDPRQ